jgi:DNA ligase-1
MAGTKASETISYSAYMLLANIVEISRQVAGTSKRLEKIDALASLLRQLQPDEIETAVAFLSGSTLQGRIGIGYAMLRDAAASESEQPSLELTDVNRALESFAAAQGRGSTSHRQQILRAMFSRATAPEQQFLTALLMGELRQGALEGIMLEAIAKAARVPAERIRRAVMMAGQVPSVARAALVSGEAGLAPYDIQLFRPVQPMLAQTADDVEEAIEDLGEASLEYKMDGARVQVHRSGEDVVVFSRSLNDVTAAVPEIVEGVRAMPARDMILDGEVISLQPDGRPQPFQITMRRFGRKLEVEKTRTTLPLRGFWFDLLYLDGSSMLDEPQSRRFAALVERVPAASVIPYTVAGDPAHAAEFLEKALNQGHEGVMAKARDARYVAGARGQTWLKVKRARSLDLVILAAEWGHGRRRGFLSNLHLGARDAEKGGFAMLGKTFKGLTDQMLAWQTEELLKREIARDNYTVYVKPEIVVEIAFNEIQVSPRYVSGLALRFARVKRYRTDKTAADADTFATVQKLASAG